MFDVPTRSNQMRRKSMQGTLLFALGIIGAIVFAVTGSIWAIGVSVVFLVMRCFCFTRSANLCRDTSP